MTLIGMLLLAAIPSMLSAQSTSNYEYDEHGRLKKSTYDNGYEMGFQYDLQDNRTVLNVISLAQHASVPSPVDDSFNVQVDSAGAVLNVQSSGTCSGGLVFDVLANDTDSDVGSGLASATIYDEVRITAVTANSGAPFNVSLIPDSTGVLPQRQVCYLPSAPFLSGNVSGFSYTVEDVASNVGTRTAQAAITSVDVPPSNTAPTASGPLAASVSKNSSVDIDVLAGASDPDGDALSIVTTGFSGLDAGNSASVVNGKVRFSAGSTAGADAFTYTISDGTATATGTVTVTVTNSSPIASGPLTASVGKNSSVYIDVLAGASDPDGDALSIVTTGFSGLASGNSASVVNGKVRFSAGGTAGADAFTYTISDGAATATGTITVTVTNSGPITCSPFNSSMYRNRSLSPNVDVTSCASDPDGDAISLVSATKTSGPSGAVVSVVSGKIHVVSGNTPGAVGVSYTITDGTATVNGSGTVQVYNRPPVAKNVTSTVLPGITYNTLNSTVNDTDPDGDPVQLVGIASGSQLSGATVTVNTAGPGYLRYYVPANSPSLTSPGIITDNIVYQISDGYVASFPTAIHSIRVNRRPTLMGVLSYTYPSGWWALPVAASYIASDLDTDQTLTFLSARNACCGSVTIVNNDPLPHFRYIPYNPSSPTVDAINYTISDGRGGTVSGTIAIIVQGDASGGFSVSANKSVVSSTKQGSKTNTKSKGVKRRGSKVPAYLKVFEAQYGPVAAAKQRNARSAPISPKKGK